MRKSRTHQNTQQKTSAGSTHNDTDVVGGGIGSGSGD
jgi:hypothetical protein